MHVDDKDEWRHQCVQAYKIGYNRVEAHNEQRRERRWSDTCHISMNHSITVYILHTCSNVKKDPKARIHFLFCNKTTKVHFVPSYFKKRNGSFDKSIRYHFGASEYGKNNASWSFGIAAHPPQRIVLVTMAIE